MKHPKTVYGRSAVGKSNATRTGQIQSVRYILLSFLKNLRSKKLPPAVPKSHTKSTHPMKNSLLKKLAVSSRITITWETNEEKPRIKKERKNIRIQYKHL